MSEVNDLLAQTLDLNGLLDYQDGAVVSRTIIKKDTGTVTLFAFDKGEGLSEHTAPFDALVQITDGEAAITIAGEEHRVKAGQFIIMPADQPHSLKAITRYKMLLVMIKQ
ncbi:cupin domain-containing protein [Geothermobacter hydrogeniphilus]|uniref:Cupin n=1 Tax=Geothermobacter hydrogeniphilus TaxID=1969733 RepID=A0A1X0XXJ2_9BACT|nr:cupin domain-containing protein [Geothermobacter hydrogeniphilus]ORJ57641.1 cupin [Geothermobacter hydrogeniphilus]